MVEPEDPAAVERLIRYVMRAPVALERLHYDRAARVMEIRSRPDGTVHSPSARYGAGHTVHKEEDMSDYNEQTLMEAVIKRVAATPDPRLRQIMTSLVKHLHGFVREVRPTWEELLAGIQFLTAVGQKCDDKRQEFILLSDSLGVSMLVDLINHGKVGNATESDLARASLG